MKKRYRLLCREVRGGAFYCVDSKTGKRTSLGGATADEAQQIIDAKNQAERQPMLNLQIAKAYLAGTDSGVSSRTSGNALQELTLTKRDANRRRWGIVAKDRALAELFPKVIIETQADVLLRVLRLGTVSTNIYLRRLHNFCVDMNWLPWPILPKRQCPQSVSKTNARSHGRNIPRSSRANRTRNEKLFIGSPGMSEHRSPISRCFKPRTLTGKLTSSASSA
jgi:hypothetical protein